MIIVSQLREMKWWVLMNECPRRRRDAHMLGAYNRGATALISSLSSDDNDERLLPLPEHQESARSWPGTSQPKLFLFLLPNQSSRYFHKFQLKTLRQRHSAPLPAHVSSFVGIRQSSICSPRGLHVTCLVGLGTIGLEAQQPPREFGKAAWLTF